MAAFSAVIWCQMQTLTIFFYLLSQLLLKVNAASALCFTLSLYHISVYFSFFFSGQLNHLNIPLRSNFTLVHTGEARPCSCPRLRDLLL